ncbi:DUF4247 domain-containing protein [Nocardia cyriacigeorgica]|uniref:DUF4247 domain-containing protein n=1 Tax=Nocardia cyriacigeorgica TaxID=135487 RepID=UPI0013D468E6|nr:DUF4247 domain-containing protein [Nocardia cyriacigeorgica]MBF6436360.1 DUF4247 domain-containing protein [Nocardia cyriacigeorgica]NEW25518.1 DUF4247 domain-containing protein [Nocardia cyriacigeorgica]
MSRTAWLVTGIISVIVAIALVIAIIARVGDSDDPREYIADTYTRAAALDEPNNGMVYTAAAAAPIVANEIAGAVRPLDKRSTEDKIFLQYRDDIVAVTPYQGGAKILVDDYRTGHRRHSHYVSGYGWASSGGGGSGGGFRGGGSGDGK